THERRTRMFERLKNGFSLARSSWNVLRNDKKLLLFPLLSGLGCLLVMIAFLIPTAVLVNNGVLVDANDNVNWALAGPLIFAYYLVNYFVVIFCNAALVHCTLVHFDGGQPTLGDGFRAAGRVSRRSWPGPLCPPRSACCSRRSRTLTRRPARSSAPC